MEIEKNIRGWQIVPSTNEEQTALEFLLKALEEKYAKPEETKDVDLTSYSPLLDHTHNMVEPV